MRRPYLLSVSIQFLVRYFVLPFFEVFKADYTGDFLISKIEGVCAKTLGVENTSAPICCPSTLNDCRQAITANAIFADYFRVSVNVVRPNLNILEGYVRIVAATSQDYINNE